MPVVQLSGLSEGKKRALLIADNKLSDDAGWDRERLAIELPELSDILVAEDQGRPKNPCDLSSALREVLSETVEINEGERRRRRTLMNAI